MASKFDNLVLSKDQMIKLLDYMDRLMVISEGFDFYLQEGQWIRTIDWQKASWLEIVDHVMQQIADITDGSIDSAHKNRALMLQIAINSNIGNGAPGQIWRARVNCAHAAIYLLATKKALLEKMQDVNARIRTIKYAGTYENWIIGELTRDPAWARDIMPLEWDGEPQRWSELLDGESSHLDRLSRELYETIASIEQDYTDILTQAYAYSACKLGRNFSPIAAFGAEQGSGINMIIEEATGWYSMLAPAMGEAWLPQFSSCATLTGITATVGATYQQCMAKTAYLDIIFSLSYMLQQCIMNTWQMRENERIAAARAEAESDKPESGSAETGSAPTKAGVESVLEPEPESGSDEPQPKPAEETPGTDAPDSPLTGDVID